jgi:hypothetical protein
MGQKKPNDPQRSAIPTDATGGTRLALAQAASATAQAKLEARENVLRAANDRAVQAKARVEDARPAVADNEPGAAEALRTARQAALDADDAVETAKVGVRLANVQVQTARAELADAATRSLAERYEASKHERVNAAAHVDRALAGTVEAIKFYVRTVAASQALYQDLSGRQEPRFSDRLQGVISTALHDFMPQLDYPHAHYRAALGRIEAEYVGLADDVDPKRAEEERQGAEREAQRLADPERIERERQIELTRLRNRIAMYGASRHAEVGQLKTRLAELTAARQSDGDDGVVVREIFD